MPLNVSLAGISTSGSKRKGKMSEQTQGGRNKHDVISGVKGLSALQKIFTQEQGEMELVDQVRTDIDRRLGKSEGSICI